MSDFAAWLREPSQGAVSEADTLLRGVPVAGGFFDPTIFGPLDGSQRRWGHLDVPGVSYDGTTITRIPVPPIADRLPITLAEPAARSPWAGPINETWISLAFAAMRHRRLVELNAPAIILDREAESAQRRFDEVLALHGVGPAVPRELTMWGGPLTLMLWSVRVADDRCVLLFLDEDRVLVQTNTECRIVTLEGHDLAPPFAPAGPDVTGVRGDLVVFASRQRARIPDRPSVGVAAYDLATGAYLAVADSRLPRFILDEPPDEGAYAIDLMTGQDHALHAAGVIVTLAHTRDVRFAWAEIVRDDKQPASTIYELSTQRPFFEVRPAPATLPVTKLGKRTATDPACSYDASLGWRLVDLTGAIGDGIEWWHRITGATTTAWSPTGSHLAALVGDDLVILEVTPAAVVLESRHPLHVRP